MDVRDKIRIFLEEKGMLKNAFARKVGMSQVQMYAILSKRRKVPRKYWKKIIKFTEKKIKIEDFLDMGDE
mgnify:CR=1 FL=1